MNRTGGIQTMMNCNNTKKHNKNIKQIEGRIKTHYQKHTEIGLDEENNQ